MGKAVSLEDIPGVGIETGNKVWDPVDMNRWLPADIARDYELANGRVAMLANVGWFWPTYVGHFEGKVSTTDPIAAIMQCDSQWWAQFILLSESSNSISTSARSPENPPPEAEMPLSTLWVCTRRTRPGEERWKCRNLKMDAWPCSDLPLI